ncbi:MAG: M20 family metallopeptidase [Ilumatobacter sp.]|uniref:M20 family metallopeptidase n=1 Tax=Ilumatobacter sp. TaxID=1967498 RepID=UPI00260FD26E|nr:M20 family metallopeptidase [Ilumatobacter sp.]MDJ0771095.1 M20 family metallopeptidase [Ilumatobacter sp.]
MADLDVLLADLQRLVDVESPSLEVDAITESADNLAGLLAERTGRPAELIDGLAGPHVRWSGGGEPAVLILGHHDTVFPIGTLAQRPFTVAGGSVTGPGVFDMKGGIVQAIHAVAALEDPTGVEMLFTSDEEVGSTTSRALVEERAAACGNVLVLEPSADGGAVKTARKGTGTFEVIVRGRASHAGLEPEAGVNALIEAAHQVLRIATFGDAASGTTVTPTVASAGTADNVVPAEARIRIDCRVPDDDEKRRVESSMAALTPVDTSTTIEVRGSIARPPMPESASATLLPLAEAVSPGIGGVAVGGGSDGNFTAAIGVPTLDGLGAVGGGAHADHEHVIADTMPARVDLIEGILRRLL